MNVYYLDTSALVKRYAHERGTAQITTLVKDSSCDLYTVRLTGPEMIAALYRKARVGDLPQAVVTRLAQEFREDWNWRYQILEINAARSDYAMDLAEKHSLRGYDAIHLAAALALHATRCANHLPDLVFLAADEALLHAATTEGLVVENPNDYA